MYFAARTEEEKAKWMDAFRKGIIIIVENEMIRYIVEQYNDNEN